MDNYSCFIKDKGYFGGFPTQEEVNNLENKGFIYFVDLTNNYEKKIKPYTTKYNYIKFPIKDRDIPRNYKMFSRFIIILGEIIKNLVNNQKIYIHFKGGHGRSGIVIAVLLSYIYNIKPEEAIRKTTIYHNKRKNMKEKLKKIGSPQTYYQKRFVINFMRNRYINDNNLITKDLCLKSPHQICLNNKKYKNAYEAIIDNKDKYKNRLYELILMINIVKFCKYDYLIKMITNTGLSNIIIYDNECDEFNLIYMRILKEIRKFYYIH